MVGKINLNNYTYLRVRAFCVHILTASGAFFAFLSVAAASQYRFIDMFWWLGLTLIIDGFDGPIARKMRVKEVLPNWSGDTIDMIVDYLTYVIIPTFALYQSNLLGSTWSSIASGMIVVSSAIYYAYKNMKTEDHFFSGFPVVWNMVVFFIFASGAKTTFSIIIIITSVILTFVPINFLHPIRVVQLRPINIFVFTCWCLLSVYALISGFKMQSWFYIAFSLCGIYLYSIGAILQLVSKLKKIRNY